MLYVDWEHLQCILSDPRGLTIEWIGVLLLSSLKAPLSELEILPDVAANVLKWEAGGSATYSSGAWPTLLKTSFDEFGVVWSKVGYPADGTMIEDPNIMCPPTMSQRSSLLKILFRVDCHTLKFVGPVSIISLDNMESRISILIWNRLT